MNMNPDHLDPEQDELEQLLQQEYTAPPLEEQFSNDLLAKLKLAAAPPTPPVKKRVPRWAFLGALGTLSAAVLAFVWIGFGNRHIVHQSSDAYWGYQKADSISESISQNDRREYLLLASTPQDEKQLESRLGYDVEELQQLDSYEYKRILDEPKDFVDEPKYATLSLKKKTNLPEPHTRSLRRRSMEQCVADAEVIVVATVVKSEPAPAMVAGDAPENFLHCDVKEVIKGEYPQKTVTTRTPSNPDEFLNRDWVIMLSPEFVAGNHPFAGHYGIGLEPKIRALVAGDD